MAHQLPRNDGSISGPEILPPAVERLHVLWRVDHTAVGLLHKSPGRTAFAPPEQASAAGFSAWAQDKFLSLRAIYIPGHMNVGADLLSRQAVTHGEWKLHPPK